MSLQGPHHVAQKSTSTGTSACRQETGCNTIPWYRYSQTTDDLHYKWTSQESRVAAPLGPAPRSLPLLHLGRCALPVLPSAWLSCHRISVSAFQGCEIPPGMLACCS